MKEYLHIIQSTNMDGLVIYSKGKLAFFFLCLLLGHDRIVRSTIRQGLK